ncbi:MAG: 16S rRNA (guanine(527)-N(7))-methyltransferase RsmG [Bacteroidales bacterium]|nr:16S rRNA (guanine(527)-N(7))-methyltransferase RsmG [Bacteroidales bacterium]
MTTLICKYFPELSALQRQRFGLLENLYREWNTKINVISRKDIDHLVLHHVLHSLGIARIISFKSGTTIMDAGTGGGFPGIPLAILFPEVHFTLVDSIGKKIKVVEDITRRLGLSNVSALNTRVETVQETFDFVTGRAVTNIPQFLSLARKRIRKTGFNDLPNGILYLTGGEMEPKLTSLQSHIITYELSIYFEEPWFLTKKLVHLYNFS